MLAIGASGVRAYQNALNTTSENIANVGNAGYSRRTTTLTDVTATGGLTSNVIAGGMGVLASGIGRSADRYLSGEVRATGADLAKTQASLSWLDRIDGALSGSQLGSRITGFFTAAVTLSADPSSLAPRSAMLEAASGTATAFTATGAALDRVAADADAGANDAVATLNGLTAALAKLNDKLARAVPDTAGAAALADQRDQLLEQMSALTDMGVTLDSQGRATVTGGGATLVDGSSFATVSYARNVDGSAAFVATTGAEQRLVSPTGGALAGIADGVQRVADARGAIEQLAQNFVNGVNAVQAQGRDLDNMAGAALFARGQGTAAVSLALEDPRGIAAAKVGGGNRDNGNLANLATLRTGGFETRAADLTAANGAALAQRRAVAEAQTTIRDNAVAARDQVSGVNLDDEAVDLVRFQQAYSASSRVIQVARDTLQTILDIR
ncbi:flagellar hook-associated protein FlgK [uncultured Sphingomonas sp.]|uniref:flagellar hook-associated protein FlgK n=1 Tax=uncultured Sphingomonas sp. TaxID=158754 RepID=UPI0035CA19FF